MREPFIDIYSSNPLGLEFVLGTKVLVLDGLKLDLRVKKWVLVVIMDCSGG